MRHDIAMYIISHCAKMYKTLDFFNLLNCDLYLRFVFLRALFHTYRLFLHKKRLHKLICRKLNLFNIALKKKKR